MTKYIITFLSTCLFLSLMIHIHHNECMCNMHRDYEISKRILELNSDKILQMEISADN